MTGTAATRETTSKRLRVRYLIVMKGYSQKEAGKMVGVSEHTIVAWAKKYRWKEAQGKAIIKQGGLSVYVHGFLEMLKQTHPDISNQVCSVWDQYLKGVQKEFGE